MISAIVIDIKDPEGLAATLACLTPAAVDGLVKELILPEAGADPAALEVGEDAGARIIAGGVALACAAARQPWLLVLPEGVRLQIGWERLVRAHIKRWPEAGGWFELNYASGGVGARAAEAAANAGARWLGLRRAEHGLLVPARQAAGGLGRIKGLRAIRARILCGGIG